MSAKSGKLKSQMVQKILDLRKVLVLPTNEESRKYRFKIFWYLYNHHCWGKRHTPLENVVKGLPSHAHGDCLRVAEELIKEGWLIVKPTSHGRDVSLDPHRSREVEEFLKTTSL